MISRKDLIEAIEQCEKAPASLNSCEKLAVYYTVYDHLFGPDEDPPEARQNPNSLQAEHEENERVTIPAPTSEFLKIVEGKDAKKVWEILDELLSTIKILNPRLYDGVIRSLEE